MCWRTEKNGKRARVYSCECADAPAKTDSRYFVRSARSQQPEFETKTASENEPMPESKPRQLSPQDRDMLAAFPRAAYDEPYIETDAEAYIGV
ncbi:MAG TPA: hypothetical protein VF596_04135 [Pyrinomonadaceae bacterium]|jgi:hypothetical protein